ncbi:DDE-type integrase/transposase/recombinase [Actinomyces vulturis]|uniref:DDE-type integrase/transposase/recombinase n=1 Tax=Actinomyces vulturis TaxID=1857645 RepID=UPI00082B32A0|nr:DDE-type integrase/transposase/recombinase [Actinomyces vulturis]
MSQLAHHSDRGSQYVSHLYTERLRKKGIRLSVGATGDSYEIAMAESVNGLYKTELIYSRAWGMRIRGGIRNHELGPLVEP